MSLERDNQDASIKETYTGEVNMLTFLSGTYFSAKKKYIYEKICSLLENGERVYLIVPEQSSFDRDRDFLMTYGERMSNLLTVTSFTHLSRDVLEENGLKVKPEADEAARNVFMSLAAEECADELSIYKKHGSRPGLVKTLLEEYAEIKREGLSVPELFKVSSALPDGILKQKTLELAKIFSAYEAMLTVRFSDETDNIRVMTQYLEENCFFSDATVFFDDFRGFTGVQIKLMTEIISQSRESFVSVLCPDSCNAYDSEAFLHAVKNCRRLRAQVSLRGIKCNEIKTDSCHPVESLCSVADSLFCTEKNVYANKTDAVTVLSAPDKYTECDLCALEIAELLKNGYRCKDISVTERTGSYVKTLSSSLRKYGIPVFEDKRVPLTEYPLIKMVLTAIGISVFGYSSEEIFSYLKTGITGITPLECAELENYAYIWQIDGRAWLRPFREHPDGFGEEETAKSAEKLIRLNKIREKLIAPIEKLKKKLENNSGEYSCRAVFEFLVDTDAAANFLSYAKELFEKGNEAAAIECSGVWDMLTQSLDALHEVIEGRAVTPRRFCELLKIILSSGDVGRIPAGIDEIVIGTAGRTRHLEPKVVFVLGCNDGVFPKAPVSSGLFTSSERRILSSHDFNLENIPENMYAEERMIAYSVITNAVERLYVSYSSADASGNEIMPSEIITEINTIVPFSRKKNYGELTPVDKIASKESAFEQFAELYGNADKLSASLKEYVRSYVDSKRYEAVKAAADKAPAEIKDRNTAVALFGEDMYISPSKAEVYYSCPFKYFCRYGLSVEKPRIADLDARINGLLIHHLLEHILEDISNKELCAMSEDKLKTLISDITEDFISVFMGGRDGKSVLLGRSLDKTKEIAFDILSRMIAEFSESSFETEDVELSIGENGDIKPYKLDLPDGGSITVGGKVDRVDVMKNNGKAYVRVVDYKTGGKDFRLGDVFAGLNMQMIIYLMCIWENGKERYGEIVPAGILYVPANNSGSSLGRHASDDEISEAKLKNGRMNGMILEDMTVLQGMEKSCSGRFINAYVDSKGVMKGAFLSLNGFRNLKKKTDEMLINMGASLHNGRIEAVPLFKSEDKSPCRYCDYKEICRRDPGDIHNAPPELSHSAAAELLNGSEEDG